MIPSWRSGGKYCCNRENLNTTYGSPKAFDILLKSFISRNLLSSLVFQERCVEPVLRPRQTQVVEKGASQRAGGKGEEAGSPNRSSGSGGGSCPRRSEWV